MTILPSHLYTKQVHRQELKKKLPFQDHNYFYEELTMLGTNRKQKERKNKQLPHKMRFTNHTQ